MSNHKFSRRRHLREKLHASLVDEMTKRPRKWNFTDQLFKVSYFPEELLGCRIFGLTSKDIGDDTPEQLDFGF